MTAPTREELRAHLEASRIAGAVATPRESNVRNYRRLADGDPHHLFGLTLKRPWSFEEVLELMAARVGVDPDPAHEAGGDRIDPERTLEALDWLADRLALAGRRRAPVLLATGHPAGLLAIHQPVAQALAEQGCTLLTPAPGLRYESPEGLRQLRHVGGVAVVSAHGALLHTHSPRPMELMLEALDGSPVPDLVLADHGYAGAAAAAGLEAVGFADSNDPGLFVGEAEGTVARAVPLDDNVLPHLYDPVTRYLLRALS